jgi:hypothetical protein
MDKLESLEGRFKMRTQQHIHYATGVNLGYTLTPMGSVLGLLWGLVDGLIGGAIFAWLYNWMRDRRVSSQT